MDEVSGQDYAGRLIFGLRRGLRRGPTWCHSGRTRLGGNATSCRIIYDGGLARFKVGLGPSRRRVLKLSSRSGHENSGGAIPIVAHGGEGGRHLPAAMRDFGREPHTALPIATSKTDP